MNIKFIGTGGAFEPHKGNASAIVTHGDTRVLIDCGYATLERLIEKDLVKDIDYVLITHLHGDHVGSLPTLLAYSEIIQGKELPIVYATEEHRADIHTFLTLTWEEKRAHYIPITNLPWIQYIDTFGQHVPEKQTYAYAFTDQDDIIFYSGDIGKVETVETFLANNTDKNVTVFLDINKKDGPAHIFYKEAQEKLAQYKVYGYHCDKATMPKECILPLVEDQSEFIF